MDAMDIVQQHQQEELERQIIKATSKPVRTSAFFCELCGEQIPEARRAAIIGVMHCVTCQQLNELKNKHYKVSAI